METPKTLAAAIPDEDGMLPECDFTGECAGICRQNHGALKIGDVRAGCGGGFHRLGGGEHGFALADNPRPCVCFAQRRRCFATLGRELAEPGGGRTVRLSFLVSGAKKHAV